MLFIPDYLIPTDKPKFNIKKDRLRKVKPKATKSDLVDDVGNTLAQIEKDFSEFKKIANKFKKASPDIGYRVQRYKTFRYIDYYIARGMSKTEAVYMVANDMEENVPEGLKTDTMVTTKDTEKHLPDT